MSSLLYEVAYALYFILPAYVANAIPVLFGGGRAIDGGKTLPDGKPIFGPHKTVRGFFAGLFVGTLTGFLLNAVFQYDAVLGFMLSLGALVGDLTHSFIKRRMGIPAGAPFPIADQLDFVLGALLFFLISACPQPPLQPLLVSPPPTLYVVLIVLVVTPPIHLLTNFLAYLMGVKKTPW